MVDFPSLEQFKSWFLTKSLSTPLDDPDGFRCYTCIVAQFLNETFNESFSVSGCTYTLKNNENSEIKQLSGWAKRVIAKADWLDFPNRTFADIEDFVKTLT